MTTIVVLGCHRSGTTLVVRLLHEMGVYMGPRMDVRNWEDADFQKTNATILDMAGGNWGKPPSPEAITEAVGRMAIPYFLSMKRQPETWGWKDPRTVLTIHALHEYLDDPRYVVIRRNKRDIVSSLTLRHGWKHNWGALVDEYVRRLDAFVAECEAPVMELEYEQLTNRKGHRAEVDRLAQFVGKEAGQAASIIQFPEKVDWRTTTGAVLTDDERQWLFDRSAELHEKHSPKFFKSAGGLPTAQYTPPVPLILHIGVEYGGSLHCCRAGAPDARLVGVDLDNSKFVGRAGVEFMTGPSNEKSFEFHDKIDLLFVDGGHEYDAIHADIVCWAGKVAEGGIIAFHDYAQTPELIERCPWVVDVKKAVDEWHWAETTWEEIEGVDSIRAFRRKPLLKRGDPFGTIGIGVPYYKASYDFFRWFCWVLIGGLETGDRFLNTQNVLGEVPIPMAHNALVMEFLNTDRDTLCIVEDDHKAPQDVIRSIRNKPENLDFDIVCATYINRHGRVLAVGYNFDGSVTDYGEYSCIIEPKKVQKTGTQEYHGACLGLVFIRRWVLEKLKTTYDPQASFWFDWRGRNSQDVNFYARAHFEAQARVGVDRDNDIIHMGKKEWSMADYWKLMDKKKAEDRQEA